MYATCTPFRNAKHAPGSNSSNDSQPAALYVHIYLCRVCRVLTWTSWQMAIQQLVVADRSNEKLRLLLLHTLRSSVNFRGHDIFARKLCIKN